MKKALSILLISFSIISPIYSRITPTPASDIRFKDVIGLKHVLNEVTEVLDFIKNPSKYDAMGANVPRGILLEGKPGTGKTLIAKAISGESGCPVFYASGPDFHQKYIGDGPALVKDLFKSARDYAKRHDTTSIIFIDEMESVAMKRGGGSHVDQEFGAIVNTLLTEMDGFKGENKKVFVIGATNFAENLDEAIMRPGRLSRIIKVPLPCLKDRTKILDYYLNKIPKGKVSNDIDTTVIAEYTSGFSPAELANIVNEAVLITIREDASKLNGSHMLKAFDRVVMGLENDFEQSKECLKRTAYHEAGHAATALIFGKSVSRMSIVSRGRALGVTMFKESSDEENMNKTKKDLLKHIMISQAGGAAEELIYGDKTLGISSDLESEKHLSKMIVKYFGADEYIAEDGESINNIGATGDSEEAKRHNDELVTLIRKKCMKLTNELLKKHKKLLVTLTEALMKDKILVEKEINAIFKSYK